MPWRCPACRTQIQHYIGENQPERGQTYRCHVCRLELVLAEDADHLVIAPFEIDHQIGKPDPMGQRTIPTPIPPAIPKGRRRAKRP